MGEARPQGKDFRTIVSIFGSTADACNAVSEVIAAGLSRPRWR